jgi:hypothetical protein
MDMDMDMEFVHTDHLPSYSFALVIYYYYYCYYIDVVNQTKHTAPQQTLRELLFGVGPRLPKLCHGKT